MRHAATFAGSGAFLLAVSIVAASAGDAPLPYRDDLTPKDRARVQRVVQSRPGLEKAESFEQMSGGAATSRKRVNANAFSYPSANLSFEEQQKFSVGNGLFRKFWVSAPSSTKASDGLGPLYNARSCQGCHLKDGRGHPPAPGEDAVSLFLRLSVPPRTGEERKALENRDALVIGEPTYGGQFQTFAVSGLSAEGKLVVDYEDAPVTLGDGATVSLRKPTYRMENLAYGPIADDVMISPRVAPQMIGLGLLQAIHPGDILAGADPEDVDGDGISGRVSYVRDPATGGIAIGRFGWKASTPNVRVQSAGAFAGDIGLSTPDMPSPYGDCTAHQAACLAFPTGEQAESWRERGARSGHGTGRFLFPQSGRSSPSRY